MSFIPSVKQENVQLFLPFSEGSGATAYDYSGNSNNGTITGASYVKIQDGGYALDFNGTSDYINTGFNVDISNDVTYIFWIKTTTTSDVRFGSYETSPAILNWFCRLNREGSGKITYNVYDGTNQINVGTGNVGFNDGKWHMVAIVAGSSSSDVVIYLDAESKDLTVFTSGIMPSTIGSRPMYIGAGNNNGSVSYRLNGKIRLPIIFNKKLSAQEVLKLYQETYIQ